jgi:hypothetical protein
VKKIIAIIVSLLAVTAVGANEREHEGSSQRQSQEAEANATSKASSSAKSEASSEANSGGNVLSSVYKEIRQAPSAGISSTNTTSPCFHSVGVGLSSPIGGISFTKGRKSADCFRLELAQSLYARNNNLAGDRVMCSITELKQALGADCIAYLNQKPVDEPVTTAETTISK